MPKVDIAINGRHYSVACDEGQETRVRDLAAMMDSRVRQLGGPAPGTGAAGETHILVLAGLMLADELTEAKAAFGAPAPDQNTGQDEELLIAAVNHLTDRVDDIAARLGRA